MDTATNRSVNSCHSDVKNKEKIVNIPDEMKRWKFHVSVKGLERDEKLCLTGDCDQLGNWKHDKVIVLNKEEQKDLYSVILDIPLHRTVQYRYCVCLVNILTKEFLVTKWETHTTPRKIEIDHIVPPAEPDVFGLQNNIESVDQGWLSAGYLTQFRFYDTPFELYNTTYKNISVKITPVDSGYNSCDSDVLDSEVISTTIIKSADNVISYAAVLNKSDCKPKVQSQYGIFYKDKDFVIFDVLACLSSDTKLTYKIDFYNHESHDSMNTVPSPSHIGYTYIMPNELKASGGEIKLPIICPNKHRPLGVMRGEYLIVRPMSGVVCDMQKSHLNEWKQSWNGLDIGHRGNGSSFKEDINIVRENTIASLNIAKNTGADMVEFDVQLSKDLIPVIYHDFDVCLPLTNKKDILNNEVLQMPLKDLKYEQLQNTKLYHVGEDPSNERFKDQELVDNQPFAPLSDFMNKIDVNLEFDVEIKWPMKQEDGTLPLENSIDMNIYIDKILEVIFCYASTRKILFTCFNPEVCLMLKMKQNLYPVMFLTQGVTKKWPKLYDSRCNTIQFAIFNALNSNLMGLAVHTEDLLRDPSQVISVRDADLLLFCWGDDNNDKDTIKSLKESGVHGVIFDRMDKYSSKVVLT